MTNITLFPPVTKKSINAMDLDAQKKLFKSARDVYYNSTSGKALMSDEIFDYLEDKIREQQPKWAGLKTTGAVVGKKKPVKLEAPCPSLDKIQSTSPESVHRWLHKGLPSRKTVTLSHKLDGGALLVVYDKGVPVSLATRGDGVIGKDVSYFIPHIPSLPKSIPFKGRLIVRMECVMKTKVFDTRWSKEFETSRAAASGIFNRQNVHPAMKNVDVVALRILGGMDVKHSEGLKYLRTVGFKTVPFVVRKSESLDTNSLVELLTQARHVSDYDLDGLVVMDDCPGLKVTADRPTYAKAFKDPTGVEKIKTKIVKIVWKLSSFGILVPKAVIAPIKIGGATITNASIYNPKKAKEKGWGVGAEVYVIRSGDIIPKIVETIKPAKLEIPKGYEWDATGTNLVLPAGREGETLVARIGRALTYLGVDNTGPSFAADCANIWESPAELIVDLFNNRFREKLKLSPAKSKQIVIKPVALENLMIASGFFDRGMGRTKLKAMFAAVDFNFRTYSCGMSNIGMVMSSLEDDIKKSIGPVATANFMGNYLPFYNWYSQNRLESYVLDYREVKPKKAVKGGKLSGQMVTMTGYRSPEQVAKIEAAGGTMVDFGSKTTVLLYKDNGKKSTKIDKARAKGLRVVEFEELGL